MILRAYEGSDRFRGLDPRAARSWLRSILANLVTDALRRTGARDGGRRERSLEAALDDSSGGMVALLRDDGSTPSHRVHRQETTAGLMEALDRLPEDQRIAVRLHHLEGVTLADIAERMGRSMPAVAGLLRRGLERLRDDERLQG